MKKLIVTFVVLALMIAGALFGYFMGLDRPSSPAVSPKKELAAVKAVPPAAPAPQPQPAPETGKRKLLGNEFRGIYITSWTAGIKRFYELTDMMASSYLNGVVIDIKDSTGKVGFPSKLPMVAETGAYERRILHLDAILKHCKERNIHTVARIAVFQDPNLAKAKPSLAVGTAGGKVWKDRKGLSWVDPASEAVWKYNVDLAKEVAALGFDEVQFDYVRFPTDGKLKTVTYPVFKHDVPKHEISNGSSSMLIVS